MTTRSLLHSTQPCVEDGCANARYVNGSGFQYNRCKEHHREQQRMYYARTRHTDVATVPAATPASVGRPPLGRTRTTQEQIERERMAAALIEMTAFANQQRQILRYSDLRVTIKLETPGANIHMAVEGTHDDNEQR